MKKLWEIRLLGVIRVCRACLVSFLAAVIVTSGCQKKMVRQNVLPVSSVAVPDTIKTAGREKTPVAPDTADNLTPGLSAATQLLIRACNNYLTVNAESQKTVDVYMIKASLYYNNKIYDSARAVYGTIIEKNPGSSSAFDAIRMTAQAYYEEKLFDLAGVWYKKLSEASSDSTDKSEALARIAESNYRLAEMCEAEGKYDRAAQEYERVAMEYPESKIADVALFNAGFAYEKLMQWSKAIIIFQKLTARYADSRLLPKTMFHVGKCYEMLKQWDVAAETYLRCAARFPSDELAQAAMYNAGFSFESGENYREAAATFEKMVELFPQAEDAADVLFRAGEHYGKVKDWESAARVSAVFSKRFGNDENRIVQAFCMTGIAQYMRGRNVDAVREFENAVATYRKLKNPGTINAYYAAKAMYTIGEIQQDAMTAISLGSQDRLYKKQILEKSELLDKCVSSYAAVIKFNLSEWTTRSIFQIGQAYEDFAFGIFGQQRPSGLTIDKRVALELGIAQAVEKYFIEKAVSFHIRNVKLGMQEKIDDKFVALSRMKLTYLPYLAAENYLAIVEILRSAQQSEKGGGFPLIARKLEMFQKMAPFQKRAIELYMQCLEYGATYQELSEYYKRASSSITGLTYSVGLTYADVVTIARDAPIPEGFDDYEKYVYKTKLLKQIEGYEDQALENYLKTIKIAEAYKLNDSTVTKAKNQIGELLFRRGRCYDLLCINAFSYPPFPRNIGEAEKEEYKVRFEEIGLKFQEQAFAIYKNLLDFAGRSYAEGAYVTHAYIRLYQNFPEEYGIKGQQMQQKAISSGPQWRLTGDTVPDWFTFACDDSSWKKAGRAPISTAAISGFPGSVPIPMWMEKDGGEAAAADNTPRLYHFRRTFTIDKIPEKAEFYLAAQGRVSLYINAEPVITDTVLMYQSGAMAYDMAVKLRKGMNLIGIKVFVENRSSHGIYPLVILTSGTEVPLPQPPGFSMPMLVEDAAVDAYVFPEIKNFDIK